jgi:uncharacterized protein YceK
MRHIKGLILMVAAGLLLSGCNSAEQKTTGSSPAKPAQGQTANAVYADGVRRVTPTELQAMLDRNEAVVIDVRNEDAYNTAHVRGSKLIPEAEVAKRSDELPKNKLIVTYCS